MEQGRIELGGTRTYRMKGRVVLRRIGEDHLLVPVSGQAAQENAVFPLNETGVFMWERLSVGRSVQQVAQDVATEFAVAPETAQTDCQTYAAELMAQQLLEEGNS